MKPTEIAQSLHKVVQEYYSYVRLNDEPDIPSLIEYALRFERLANELEDFANGMGT